MITGILILLLGLQGPPTGATDTLTIDEVYQAVRENYPLHRKKDLQQQITDLQTRIARAGYYPDVTFSARASYQSDVTTVTFVPPGATAPEFSKDHYRLAMELSQPVYAGGAVAAREELEEVTGRVRENSVDVALHRVREQVNRVYFSILLLQKQAETIQSLSKQLREQLGEVRSKVRNGVLLPSQASILEAELVKTEQDSIRTAKEIGAAYRVLGTLSGEEIAGTVPLSLPETTLPASGRRMTLRPEYDLFESNRELIDAQSRLNESRRLPRLSAFVTTAYGRPGLDVFNDDLQAYYIAGLQLQWNVKEWLNGGREKAALRMQKRQLLSDEQAFTRQLESDLVRTRSSIQSLEEVLERDRKILRLREKVVTETKSRLINGTVTATEYLAELTKAHQARLTHFLHRVQLEREKMEYVTKMGISWNE